jgi:alkanesulfonate monooxygenase SsuD/methylene tetrahydromethanopterin reductase-like flavin-dependent oxidoreductase (luciferase family)
MWVAEAWGRDAFSLLTLLADRTKRVKLGTSIVNIYSRTPAALVQHFATLDELSEGRAIIGLGTSGIRVIEHFHGVPFQPAFTRLHETVVLIQKFLGGEPVYHDGEVFKLQRGFRLRFEPVRKRIPIYLATLRAKAVRLTTELADGWMPTMVPIERFHEQSSQVAQWLTEAGRAPGEFTIRAPGGVTVANDERAIEVAKGRAAGTVAFYCARMGDYYYEQLCALGYREQADVVRAAWDEGGSAAATGAVPEAMQQSLSFVGTTEQCIERLDQQAEAGAALHGVGVMENDPGELRRILAKLIG